MRRLINAVRYSLAGFRAALSEAAFRQELILALVLIVELLNSAVEAAVDRISTEMHELSKRAKDLGSAAVMLSLVNLAVVWLLILMN